MRKLSEKFYVEEQQIEFLDNKLIWEKPFVFFLDLHETYNGDPSEIFEVAPCMGGLGS